MCPNATVLPLCSFFTTHNTRITNFSHHIPSHLTQPVQHVNSHLQLFPSLTVPHCISLNVFIQEPPWHISHTSLSRPFSSRVLSVHIRHLSFSQSHRILPLFKIRLSQAKVSCQVTPIGPGVECLHYIRTLGHFTASFFQDSSCPWCNSALTQLVVWIFRASYKLQ